jgi:hypothetical protein
MPPAASIPPGASLIYPCMVGGMNIDWANQVWASELTYLRMAHGSLGLRQRARASGRIDPIFVFIITNAYQSHEHQHRMKFNALSSSAKGWRWRPEGSR